MENTPKTEISILSGVEEHFEPVSTNPLQDDILRIISETDGAAIKRLPDGHACMGVDRRRMSVEKATFLVESLGLSISNFHVYFQVSSLTDLVPMNLTGAVQDSVNITWNEWIRPNTTAQVRDGVTYVSCRSHTGSELPFEDVLLAKDDLTIIHYQDLPAEEAEV